MGVELRATDRKSESVERRTNMLLVFLFLFMGFVVNNLHAVNSHYVRFFITG